MKTSPMNKSVYTTVFKSGLKPDPYIDFVEWANKNMVLTTENSVEPGRYRSSRTPYVEEILRELSPQSPTQEVVVIKPTQFGFTTLANIVLFATADLYPGPSMMALPTGALAEKHSKKKVSPSVKKIKPLRGKIKDSKSRDSGNTILLKEYPGGSWAFTGANSPAAARSDSIRYLILDDYDGFPPVAGGEGPPGPLFKKRTDAFGNRRKIYINSTPTEKGASAIDEEYEESSQGLFCVRCPYCKEYIYLEFGGKDKDSGIKFNHNDGEVYEAWYICQECGGRIGEHHKTFMFAPGNYKYIHRYPERKKRGFKVNAFASPLGWLSWISVCDEFLKCKGDQESLRVWVNTRLAESFEVYGDKPEWERIKARAEIYAPRKCPAGCMMITASVDVQDNRLAVLVRGWGRDEESWLLHHEEIYGDPAKMEVWNAIDEIRDYNFEHVSGVNLQIVSMGVDIGGHNTQEVYNYCRARGPQVFALQGASKPNKPVLGKPTLQDITWRGKTIKNGVQLWSVGADTAKSTIYGRLKLQKDESKSNNPRYYHFYEGLEDEFYQQLCAEKRVTRFIRGFPKVEWVKIRPRNEVLDLEVYAYAAAIRAGLLRMDWDALESAMVKKAEPEQQQKKQRETRIETQPRAARNRPAWFNRR